MRGRSEREIGQMGQRRQRRQMKAKTEGGTRRERRFSGGRGEGRGWRVAALGARGAGREAGAVVGAAEAQAADAAAVAADEDRDAPEPPRDRGVEEGVEGEAGPKGMQEQGVEPGDSTRTRIFDDHIRAALDGDSGLWAMEIRRTKDTAWATRRHDPGHSSETRLAFPTSRQYGPTGNRLGFMRRTALGLRNRKWEQLNLFAAVTAAIPDGACVAPIVS